MRQSLVLIVMLQVATSLALAGPASKPDNSPKLADKDVMAVRKLVASLGHRQWDAAIVETFQAKPDKPVWSGGKIEYKDGALVAENDAAPPQQFVLQRLLPESLAKADGIQVQVWLQAEPSFRKVGNNVIRSHMMQLGLGAGGAGAAVRYYFAYSTNGMSHRIIAPGVIQTGALQRMDAFPDGKLVHLTVELVGRKIRCSRDKTEVQADLTGNAVTHMGNQPMLSLFGYFKKVRLLKVTYRALTPVDRAAAKAVPWDRTAFAGQADFDRHLVGRVIPRLDAELYEDRDQANRLIEAVWPLSRPAVLSRLKSGRLTPELEVRLKALADSPLDEKVQPPEKNDPADAPPAGVKEMEPSTQPASPARD